jgi:hypothetical protein
MASGHGEDLGSGVYASPAPDGRLVVTSPRLDLGWRVAEGRVPGTAVMWHDQAFEVETRSILGKGHRWTLRRWGDAGTMRDVVPLDSRAVAVIAEAAESARRGMRYRAAALLLLPILGLAPAAVQERWHSEWLYPAELATWVSSALELLGGAAGVAQGVILAFGGQWFLPTPLRFLAIVGPLMSAEAIFRLTRVAAGQGPTGSMFGLPFDLLRRPETPAVRVVGPKVRAVDDDPGRLEVVSPVGRFDWTRDGVLSYRDRCYRLDRVDREGRDWVYQFVRRGERREDEPELRLRAPARPDVGSAGSAERPPSILRTTLVTAAVTLGPRVDQERWAGHLGVSARWLTVAGAAAELVGGLTNLGRDATTAGAILVVLDVFLILEGSLRLLSVLGGRPMGSLFGWLLRPLYRSSLPGPG